MTHASDFVPSGRRPENLNAFCQENAARLDPTGPGPLSGTTFAAKDVFDVAGVRTGFGQPSWLNGHEPARETAEAIQKLVDAGAKMVGKTLTDELTYSLAGINAHYGTPVNVHDPDRTPGGSSSGSAAAVAGGLCDFALGTDCGGSIRLPASFCGVLGFRPSFGRVSLKGALALAQSFDVAGWFARDAGIFELVGSILLDPAASRPMSFGRVGFFQSFFDLFGDFCETLLASAASSVRDHISVTIDSANPPKIFADRVAVFQTIQAYEVWANHGDWVRRTAPVFGPGVRERFEAAARVTLAEYEDASRRRGHMAGALDGVFGDHDVLCWPTVPRAAPLKSIPDYAKELDARAQAMSMLSIAGLFGLPQVSLPILTIGGLPLGLSLIGKSGTDEDLLRLSRRIMTDHDHRAAKPDECVRV